ncbi:hypothetical [Yersinia pestis KIM10+]|uniref:Uncharacterized protein n=1 Tax=Yersinia pestis TaxID=632 RepID=Q8CK89_YERPE|nr:hypothetical [Yersinia pestis KIM10+]
MISPTLGTKIGTDCSGNLPRCTHPHKKSRQITLLWRKNTDHLLMWTNMFIDLFIRLALMVTTLNTLHYFNLILTP